MKPTPQVGQRWLYTIAGLSIVSKVIFEIQSIENGYAKCRYVQVISKGYDQDRIGFVDMISVSLMQNHDSHVYLEGQDKAQ